MTKLKLCGQVLLGLLGAGLMICVTGTAAHAQNQANVFAGYSYGTTNFGCSSESCGGGDPALHGYSAAFFYNFNRYIGLEANFSGHNGTTTLESEAPTSSSTGYDDTLSENVYVYTFGPRLSLPVSSFSLYTHFLVGYAHLHGDFAYKCLSATGSTESSCGSTDYYSDHGGGFAFKTGGGVDWNHGRWGIRILEVDYIKSETSTTETEKYGTTTYTPYSFILEGSNFELSTGVTFAFGKKY